MRGFSRRRIQSILLLALVCLMLLLVMITVSRKTDQVNYFGQNNEIDVSSGSASVLKNGDLSLSSACLSRNILNGREVQLYSNRLPNKKYYLTIGIPTIARTVGNKYLMKTLNSLAANQTVGNTSTDLLIVLQLGDEDKHKRSRLAMEIKEKYPYLINNGVLDIIQVYHNYYPSFHELKRRFGDSEARVKWRSKQVIDFSFLSCYCYGLGKYHLQLEDDVIASPYYYLKLKDFIENYEAKEKWFTLDASILGYIGKVYHNYDLNEIASFYYIFFDEMPVDWMEYTWREIKGQKGRWRLRAASLFQHIGLTSSLSNKKQRAKEAYFDKHAQKFLGLNPPAIIHTDLNVAHKTKIKAAYEQGAGYFWGTCHGKSSCYIKVIFKKAIPLHRVIIETGGNFATNDTIHHGSLKIGTNPNTNDCVHYVLQSPATFIKGTLDMVFSKKQTVSCLKIEIRRQMEWVFVREINVWSGT